jgi:murein DD-endopeptidase MepM/ murein hydrolase activator NlpD
VPLRRPRRPARLGRVAARPADPLGRVVARPERAGAGRGARLLAVAALVAATGAPGCAGGPRPGQGEGAWYVVRSGDNLWRLSQRYDVSVDTIRRTNRVSDVHSLRIGQRLWIPGADPDSTPPVSAPAPAVPRTLEQRWGADCSDASRDLGLRFEWPVLGTITSAFGVDRRTHHHDGIDIAAPRGSPVTAAEAGKVVYAGSGLGDYGRVIVIRHQGRWATVYAHNDRILVHEGDFVEKGDLIARVGQTGNATAPHLHFEIRRSNRPRDPLACLP